MRTCIIPARGGSVRIPRKNLRMFFGEPMICWPIKAAVAAGCFDRIIVSTDDDEIATIAREARIEVVRRNPDDGSRGTQDVAAEALRFLRLAKPLALACVIYPCSPLLLPNDILSIGHELCARGAVFSFAVGTEPLRDAGCCYWGGAAAFGTRALYAAHSVMVPLPEERCVDVNAENDWLECERKFAKLKGLAYDVAK